MRSPPWLDLPLVEGQFLRKRALLSTRAESPRQSGLPSTTRPARRDLGEPRDRPIRSSSTCPSLRLTLRRVNGPHIHSRRDRRARVAPADGRDRGRLPRHARRAAGLAGRRGRGAPCRRSEGRCPTDRPNRWRSSRRSQTPPSRGVVAIPSGRYFGFVIGGALPAALAADWLTSTWDQNAGLVVGGPSAAVVEEVAGEWLKDLLGLPADGVVLRSSRDARWHTSPASRLLAMPFSTAWAGMSRRTGSPRSPPIRIVAGAKRHVTIDRALRLLGLGSGATVRVDVDSQGRMRLDALEAALRGDDGPTIVCAQAGEVDTGAFDPFDRVAALCRSAEAWLHVDGAFGLWAAASPQLRHLTAGVEQRGFLGDGRTQVAQRPLRLRPRVRRAPGGSPFGDAPHGRLPRRRSGRCTRSDGLDAGVLQTSARLCGLRRVAVARTVGRRRSRR